MPRTLQYPNLLLLRRTTTLLLIRTTTLLLIQDLNATNSPVPQSTVVASNYHLVTDLNGTSNAMAGESTYGSDSALLHHLLFAYHWLVILFRRGVCWIMIM